MRISIKELRESIEDKKREIAEFERQYEAGVCDDPAFFPPSRGLIMQEKRRLWDMEKELAVRSEGKSS